MDCDLSHVDEPVWIEPCYDDGGLFLPPEMDDPGREPGPGPAPDELRIVSWGLAASVVGLGSLKLLFLLAGGWLSTLIVAIVFVLAHGVFIAGGASWFWGYRYR